MTSITPMPVGMHVRMSRVYGRWITLRGLTPQGEPIIESPRLCWIVGYHRVLGQRHDAERDDEWDGPDDHRW